MHIPSWLATLAVCGLPLAALAAPSIRLANFDYPPFCDTSQPDGGSLVAITREAFALQGIRVQLVQLPWSRVIHQALQARVDGVIGIWPEDAQQMGLRSAAPIYISQIGVYLPRTQRVPVRLAALRGKRAGTVQGYNYGPRLLGSGMLLEPVHDDETNLRKLQTGRIEVAVMEKAVGDYLLQTPRIRLGTPVHWGGVVLGRQPLSIGFTATPQQDYWARQFDAGFKRLKQSGRYRQIAGNARLHAYLPD